MTLRPSNVKSRDVRAAVMSVLRAELKLAPNFEPSFSYLTSTSADWSATWKVPVTSRGSPPLAVQRVKSALGANWALFWSYVAPAAIWSEIRVSTSPSRFVASTDKRDASLMFTCAGAGLPREPAEDLGRRGGRPPPGF